MHQYEFSQNSYLHVYHIIAEQMNRYYFGILIRKIMICTLSICEHALHFLSQVVTQKLQCNNTFHNKYGTYSNSKFISG